MATTGSVLSQEKFLCPVCLDLFTKPVSTPCGHNFCSACIHKYWDNSDVCQCPFCKKVFPARPELQVNTVISELVAECRALGQVEVSSPGPQIPAGAHVLCDICSEKKEKAVKSCLMCLASFCEAHLEPHRRVAGLKSHTLLDPVRNLEDKICKTHNKITELFCRTDQACVCALCLKDDHKGHHVVSLEEKYEEVMSEKDETIENIQQMIRSRSGKIAEIKNAVDEAEKEKKASLQVLADLMRFIQRSQAELVEVIEERHRATKQKAEGFLTELKKEVDELESRSTQLVQLSQSDDHHHFLQSFPTLSSPSHKDWTGIGVHSNISVEAVRSAATQLKQRVDQVMEELPLIKLKRMREHAVDLTLDPDTAYFSLRISQNGKQVTKMDTELELPHNPERFETCPEVLAKEGFTAGKFYYEVQVRGDSSWALGVARESVDRKASTALTVKHGFWTVWHNAGVFKTSTKPSVDITLKETVERVGVFVDYDKGVVSFYDVDSESHIYSFTGCQFTDKLHPYFCFADNTDETSSAPFIITPVQKTH